jgi:ankyrin repeat protein
VWCWPPSLSLVPPHISPPPPSLPPASLPPAPTRLDEPTPTPTEPEARDAATRAGRRGRLRSHPFALPLPPPPEMDLPLPLPPRPPPPSFGLVSVCGLLTELEDVGRVVALAGYGHEARRLPFLCTSLARDDELLVATRMAVYGGLGRTRLMYAARAGDVRRVTALLRPRGAEDEVDATDAGGCTALHHASAAGQTEVVRLLLDKGADKDAEDGEYWRPLHYASAMGHVGVARLLLQRGAVTDADHDDMCEEPLHVACKHGHVEVVRLLIDAGADQEAWDHRARTPYIRAIEQDQEAVVLFLLNRGQRVDGRMSVSSTHHTALAAAASREHESMARLLLDRGADVNVEDDAYRTPLHGAACAGSASITRLFLERGADPGAWYPWVNENFTPMHEARDMLGRAEAAVPVDPTKVQKLSEVVAIYEALLGGTGREGEGGGR